MIPPLTAPPTFPGAPEPYIPENGYPDWASLLAADSDLWSKVLAEASGPTVLVASHTGLHGAVVTLDSLLAVALTLRGARVRMVLCDGVLQGCLMTTLSDRTPPEMIAERRLQQALCKPCFNRGTRVYRPLGLPIERLSDHLTPDDYSDVETAVARLDPAAYSTWRFDGAATGEHGWAGALRYFARGEISQEPLGVEVARRYLEGAGLEARAFSRLVAQTKPDVGVLHHGIYSPQGIAADVLRGAGADVATWVVAYRKNCFIFSHDDTYHHTLIHEPASAWEHLRLTDDQARTIGDYLESRAAGGRDWIYFHGEADSDFRTWATAEGIDPAKPLVTALTNVVWDAQLHYPANVFPTMLDWLAETIRHYAGRPDLQLLIRVHPAETRGGVKSRQLCVEELARLFPQMPPNVFVAGPEDPVNSYAAALASDACLIYGTKMGVELAPLGVRCIVAGEAWVRGKGVTLDAQSKAHYFELLDRVPFAGDEGRPDRERALRYAYHFFFRRMVPLPFLQPNGSSAMYGLQIKGLADLLPGRHRGLDVLCDGVMSGAPFVYPAEQFGVHDAAPAA